MSDGTEIYRTVLTDTNSSWLFIEVMVLLACEEDSLVLSWMAPPLKTLNALEGARSTWEKANER